MNRHVKKIISIFKYDKKKTKEVMNKIEQLETSDYITFCNPECIGIMYSVKELFDEKKVIELYELFNKKEIKNIALKVKEKGVKQVIFATMAYGYKSLAEEIYNLDSNITIKFLWHGSHALFVNRDEEYFLQNILDLQKRNIVKEIGFLKESMAEFYKLKGYNSVFVMNNVTSIKNNENARKNKNTKLEIGVYAAGDRWEKNTYNQLSACAMIKDAIVDVVPNTSLSKSFSKLMGITLKSNELKGSISRAELFERMKKNDINLYVTFTECAPMIPLESLELGVPCLVGDNNHYFKGTELEQYLVVKSEDNIDEIYEKIKVCVENKEKIMKLYKKWKEEYNKKSLKSIQEFLNM